MNVQEVLSRELTTDEDGNYVVRPKYLVNIIEKGLRATAKEMAIEYGCYYVDESELESRINECVAAGIEEMELEAS